MTAARYAAALYSHLFESVARQQLMPSWTEVLTQTERKNQAIHVVHGALLPHDIPDLTEIAGAHKIRRDIAREAEASQIDCCRGTRNGTAYWSLEVS